MTSSNLKIQKAQALLGQRQATLHRTMTKFIKQNIKEATVKKKDRTPANAEMDSPELDSSDEYDTDLEIEERESTPMDLHGVRTYTRTCRKLGVNPIASVTHGLKTSELRIRGRGLSVMETLAICNALTENGRVSNIYLDGNKLGPLGTQYVACVMYENNTITNVNLSENAIERIGCESVCRMMVENSHIVKLDLSCNNLQDTDGPLIGNVIQENKTLQYLNLSRNSFGDISAECFGPAIGLNESLRHLDLSWNKIRPPGGVVIAKGVQENVVMTSFNMAYNGISVAGALAMATALHENDSLTDLDLTCNRIFDSGFAGIGKALLVNESLCKLKIANNPVTTASVITLLTVLQKNTYSGLEVLDMSSVHIYKDALALIEEIQGIRPTFEFLYGGVVSSDDTFGGDGVAFNNRNPFVILKEFMTSKNLRLMDLFKYMDKDGSGSVSREEFVHGLEVYEVPLTKSQVERLIKMLDKDGDGEVDYEELVTHDKEFRRKEREKKRRELKQKEAKES